jgi:PAS domain-containing protein
MMTTEVALAVISLISALSSGVLLYKTNVNKSKAEENKTLLEAEASFRQSLLDSIDELKSEINGLKIENDTLRVDLFAAKVKIEELGDLLGRKVHKTDTIGNFIKYLPNPAWLKTMQDGEFKIAYVNSMYCYTFGVSEEYVKGHTSHYLMGADCEQVLKTITEEVVKYKRGARAILPLDLHGKTWHIFKFPVIECGKIVGVGGMLMDCGA